MEIKTVKTSKLKSNTGQIEGLPKNPRFIKDEKFKKLVKSLSDDPEMMELREIIVYDNNGDLVVIAGNMRLKACVELGIKEVLCKILPQSTPVEKLKAYTLKDNASFGEHDFDLLREDWDIEFISDCGIDLPDSGIIIEPETGEDNFDINSVTTTDIVPGDLFQIGEHRLLCGDSTEVNAVSLLMNGQKADMVFTDPPWNVNYGAVKEGNAMGYKPRTIMNDAMSTSDFKDFMGSAFAMMAMHSKKGCPTYVVMSAQEWGNLMLSLHYNSYHWSSTIIWNKSHLVMSRKDYHTKYEPIWYGWLEGGPRLCPVEDRKQSDVWDVDRPTKSDLHPTTKPIELISIALRNSSRQGDLIMELFTGSGSTMVAAHQLKRICYGMELDPKYCQVIVNRMKHLDPSLLILRNGQPYEPK